LNNSIVRDLAWVIDSPPLIQGNVAHCSWTTTNQWHRAYREFTTHLTAIKDNPRALQKLISEQTDRRLGHRFETLLTYWFNSSERYDIICQNLQVQDTNRTLGEFDFIVKDKQTKQTQHWEVACKFYLGIGDTNNIENWHGPMLKDRLAIKYERMQSRQSRLSKQVAAKKMLAEMNTHIDQHICLMKGRLFYPISQQQPQKPSLISPDHQHGWWARPSQFTNQFQHQALRWRFLNKQQWLSTQLFDANDTFYSAEELANIFSTDSDRRPTCIAGFNIDGITTEEVSRGFLVPKDWAEHLNLTDNMNT